VVPQETVWSQGRSHTAFGMLASSEVSNVPHCDLSNVIALAIGTFIVLEILVTKAQFVFYAY